MKNTNVVQIEAPRIVSGKPLLIAGLRGHFTTATWADIPRQWQRFASYLGKIPGQIGRTTYGLCFSKSDGIDYLSGVEVSETDRLPGEFIQVNIPAQTYAVFPHREHVSKLRQTLDAIWSKGLPESGYHTVKASDGAPDFFERYGEGFDPQTGRGDIEVWIPVTAGEQRIDSTSRIAS